jgi:endonuclease/exonuclease/phosphatase family metal-dependent hydrolase
MAKLRLATFNCENLFARFKFNKNIDPAKVSKNGFTINDAHFDILKDAEKRLTAEGIVAVDADIIALQEVENLDVLKRFRNDRLANEKYVYAMLIDGNDPRKIDVAVLTRYPITRARSNQDLRKGNALIFSRDCLEVDMEVDGKPLTLFVNHLKSMFDKNDARNGRKNTRAKRLLQSKTVLDIVKRRFGDTPGRSPWVILGDFNDYLDSDQGTTTGIADLVTWDQVENVMDRLPEAERWTHFFDGAPVGDEPYRQLDYLLLSTCLATATGAQPTIERRGLTTNATKVTEKRFKGVTAKIAASDHCPVAIDITV